MAEGGSTDLAVAPENNQSDDGNIIKSPGRNSGRTGAHHLRASIGSYHAGNSSLRSSTELSDSVTGSPKKVPHYLRASTGSCHDFCKYGRKHVIEEKPWRVPKKKTAKPSLQIENPMQISDSGEQKKKKTVNHNNPSIESKNHLPDLEPSPQTKSFLPKPKTSVDKKTIAKHNPAADIKTRLPYTKASLQKPQKSFEGKSSSSSQNDPSRNKTRIPKYKPSPEPPEIIKRVLCPSKENDVPLKKGPSTDNKVSRTEKRTLSPVKLRPVKVKPSSSGNLDGLLGKVRRNSDMGIVRKTTAPKALTRKSSILPPSATLSPKIPVKVALVKPSSSSNGLPEKVRRNSDVGIVRKTTAPKAHMRKALTPTTSATLSPKFLVKVPSIKSRKGGNLKMLPPLNNRNGKRVENKTSKEEASEKTLHVIDETQTANSLLNSIPDDEHTIPSFPSPSSSKSSSPEEDDTETNASVNEADAKSLLNNKESVEIVKVESVKEDQDKTLRKKRVVGLEVKNSSPVKLKFRSGKVVDLHSENNTPRRLRFRKATVMGAEASNSDLRRRNLRKAEVNDDANHAEPSSGKIVLKHQDVQEGSKKDAQGLLNNVIEETASKLVESRKSKVKALVGAFETVISLQDGTKPSSVQTVS